jgi:hypothetical protein
MSNVKVSKSGQKSKGPVSPSATLVLDNNKTFKGVAFIWSKKNCSWRSMF